MKITIEYTEEKGWSIHQDEKFVDHLSWDEMIGLTAAATMPESRPTLHWLMTKEEHDAKDAALQNYVEDDLFGKLDQ